MSSPEIESNTLPTEPTPPPPTTTILRPAELLLIRHAQSEANAGPCDVCDCGLTETGRQQAVRVGERLRRHFLLDGFRGLTSPYRRARETAQWISQGSALSFQVDEGCREWGMTCEVDGKHYPEEQLERAAMRLDSFLKRLRPGGKYVIISHATPIFLMIQLMVRGNVAAALGQCAGSFWEPITNCGVTHVRGTEVMCLARQLA